MGGKMLRETRHMCLEQDDRFVPPPNDGVRPALLIYVIDGVEWIEANRLLDRYERLSRLAKEVQHIREQVVTRSKIGIEVNTPLSFGERTIVLATLYIK